MVELEEHLGRIMLSCICWVTRLLALSRKRREGSLLFQYGRGERALYSSNMEEERGLSILPYWKRGEGSLLFQYGRGERDRSPSILEEARGLSTLPIWKRQEVSLLSQYGRGEKDRSPSILEEGRGLSTLSPLPHWKKSCALSSLLQRSRALSSSILEE